MAPAGPPGPIRLGCVSAQAGGPSVKQFIRRFVDDEDAQDLMEYAFLGAFIGLVGVLVWQNIVTLLGDRYTEYNSNVQSLWTEPDP